MENLFLNDLEAAMVYCSQVLAVARFFAPKINVTSDGVPEMSSLLKFRPSVFIYAAGVLLMTQTAASADPFGNLGNIINNQIQRSVEDMVNRGTNAVTTNVEQALFDALGLNPSTVNNSAGNTGSDDKVLRIYEAWYGDLSGTDKETVSWLIMQHARNQTVTFETISSTEWFMQKPIAEQSQVASVFFKLQQVIDASANDRGRFLAFAFCVNSGTQNCTP